MRPLTSRTLDRAIYILILLLNCSVVFAQDQTVISGRVTDAKGVPIPAAGVSVSTSSGNVAEALTGLDRSFKFEGIPEGVYRLTVEIVGFLKNVNEAIDASADANRNLVIRMDPLPRPKSAALPEQASKTKQQEAQPVEATVFQTAEVTDLPGFNQFQQNMTQLSGDITALSSQQDSILFISGNSANMDAGDFNNPEFRGQMMDAARQMGFQIREFDSGGEPGSPGGGAGFTGIGGGGMAGGMGGSGGGPGGGMGFAGMGGRGGRGANFRQPVIEGSLSETYANSALNARNYSLTGQKLDKPVQIQNNFGITVGGVLPFFKSGSTGQRGSMGPMRVSRPGWSFTYSGSRNRSALDILTTVPTDLERAGDFSQTYTQAMVIDPVTGQQTVVAQPVQLYMNPNDPSSRFTKLNSIDSIANQLLEYIPRANMPCPSTGLCVNNYALERSLPTSSDQIQGSVTGLRLTAHDNFGVNYSMRRGSSLSAATFEGLDTYRTSFAQNVGISGTHSFQARLIANWRVTLNRTKTESTNAFAYQQNVEGELGITGVSQDPMNWGPPTISFTNYGNISLAAPAFNQNQNFSVSGGFNKIGNRHSIRAGGDVSWNQRNSKSDSNGRGTFTFNGYATILLDPEGRQVSGSGNDFADFLRGFPYSTSRRYVDSTVNPYGNALYLRNHAVNLYIMDNWRVRSNLTVNYGLRYEYTGPSYEKYNRLTSLDAPPDYSALAQVFPEQKGPLSGKYFPRSLVEADRNNFAPRIGIAWRPRPRSPIVIRAGYGIGYNTAGYGSIVSQLINQAPFAISQNIASDRSDPLTLQVGFPVDPELTILNTYAIDPTYRPSYVQQWNLDIQTQISRIYVLTAAYNGAKGTGLDVLRAPKPTSNASNFIFQTDGADSIYHGMNVQLSRRFSRGFNINGSYTLSKSIDDSPGSVAQNDLNLKAERALSSQDQRHSFQTSFAYELPMGRNRKFLAGASTALLNLVEGWTFNGNLSLVSGNPITARYASSSGSGSGAALYNAIRPDATGAQISLSRDERSWQHYFNTAAFAIPAGEYGNSGRNTITGPGSYLVNLSVRKGFRLDESGRRIDFSWQIQNLLNHPNWGGVSTTVNALNFGQVTSVRQMRSMSVNLRIRF